MKQNVTLSVEKDLIKKGKVMAARKDSSISKMLADLLKDMVESDDRYEAATPDNAKVGLMLCCPITHQAKGYPFEIDICGDSHVSGVVLSDQVKCLDWQAHGIRKKGVASRAELEETLEKLKTLLE
jgi:hypothetical protein